MLAIKEHHIAIKASSFVQSNGNLLVTERPCITKTKGSSFFVISGGKYSLMSSFQPVKYYMCFIIRHFHVGMLARHFMLWWERWARFTCDLHCHHRLPCYGPCALYPITCGHHCHQHSFACSMVSPGHVVGGGKELWKISSMMCNCCCIPHSNIRLDYLCIWSLSNILANVLWVWWWYINVHGDQHDLWD